MKKKLISLFAAYLCAASVMATPVTFTASDFNGQGQSGSGSEVTVTKDGVTFTCDKAYGDKYGVRCYKDGTITISSQNHQISSINFSFNTVNGTTYDGDLNSYTYVNSTYWTSGKLSKQARMSQIIVNFSDEVSQELEYNLNEGTLTATVKKKSNGYYSGDIIIPEKIIYAGKNYSVTGIGDDAFYGCSNLTSITIPNSITSIGNRAFSYCGGLASVIIPNSVTSIGDEAFSHCSGLASVTIGNSVTSIGEWAFCDCSSLTSVTIPNSVTSIGEYAFYKCTGLTSVTIPNSVKSIRKNTFENCSGLSSVTIGKGVAEIEFYAFRGCTSLTSVVWNAKECDCSDYLIDNICYNPFCYHSYQSNDDFDLRQQITSFIFGEEVEVIPDILCYDMTNLKSVVIPNSVKSIGWGAFKNCMGLTSVTIGNSVTSIGEYAFYDCKGITSISIPNSVTSIGEYAFYDCAGITKLSIGRRVTSISNYAFTNCKGITSVSIPNSVTSIGDDAFSGCTGLTSVMVGNSVTSIGEKTFYGCTGLTSVTIPNSVTNIAGGTFYGCTGISKLIIGSSVSSIGDYAFANCKNFDDITCYATTVPTITKYTFDNIGNKKYIYLYVPEGRERAYARDDYWGEFDIQIKKAEEITTDGNVTVVPSDNTAEIVWPSVNNAETYEIVITKAGEIVCRLTFNAQGQLISIAFNAPARNNELEQTQVAGFAFTVTGLEPGTQYSYSIIAKNASGTTLSTETGTFVTKALEGLDQISQEPSTKSQKQIKDGQILILKGDKTYTATGQEL